VNESKKGVKDEGIDRSKTLNFSAFTHALLMGEAKTVKNFFSEGCSPEQPKNRYEKQIVFRRAVLPNCRKEGNQGMVKGGRTSR
jgi:hypothetical protein